VIERFNKRIIFQKFTTILNENGFEIQEWSDYKTVWASVSNLNGREYFAAQAVQAEKTIKFTIRCNKNITESMRIIFEGNNYDIAFIDNIKYGNEFMEIKALAVI
jgi:SPP1 family predicted phage head-tail adaptor